MLAVWALAAVACAGGCSREYDHGRLDTDGPEGRRVTELVGRLRTGGVDGLDAAVSAQAMEGLTESQLKELRFGLEKIVAADSAALTKIERFGDRIYRAVLALEADGRSETLAMLLAFDATAELRWIGRN